MIVYSVPGFEEPVNSWTHLLAAFAFFSLTLYLLRPSGIGRKHILSILVFGFTSVFLFSMSGVYHLLATGGTARYVLQILDHAGIYMLIAGSFTAIHGVLFRGFLRWGVISFVWVLAINGIVLGTVFFDNIPDYLNLIFFLGFGWLGIFTGVVLWRRKGFDFIRYFLFGGLSYTVGAVLEYMQAPVIINGVIGGHELFHVAVILGTTFHWIFVIQSIKSMDKDPVHTPTSRIVEKIRDTVGKTTQGKRTITSFAAASLLILTTSFILTVDRFTWMLEVFPILVGLPVLLFTYTKFRFTALVYWLLILHFIILAVGAVYTYQEVPLGLWMQEWFGFERNNYDKIGHFAQGFIPAILVREILLRTSPLQKGKWLGFIVVSICLAISALYELIEWWVAVAQGASAEAFLGTQGYEWDAQSDMFMALIGAVVALVMLSGVHDREIDKVVKVP